MQKWEYRVGSSEWYPSHKQLNRLGLEGWELVSVIVEVPTKAIDFVACFKRPLVDENENKF